MTRIAISKLNSSISDDKIFDAVKSAIDNLGGIEKYVNPGERVLIKPNFVSPRPPPTTTDVRVIKATALQVKDAGAKPIIGESSSAMTYWWREGMTTEDVMDLLGMTDIAREINVDLEAFDKEGIFRSVKVKIPGAIVLPEVEIAEIALKVDKIIPLPVLSPALLI